MNKNLDQDSVIREVAEIVAPRYEATTAQLCDYLLSGALKSCMNHAEAMGDGVDAVTRRAREFAERIIAEAVAASVSDLAFEAIKAGKDRCDYDKVDVASVLFEMADDIKALAVEMDHPRRSQTAASASASA